MSEEASIISAGVVIEGTLSSSGNIKIDGKIKGDVIVQGNVTVGESGIIDGQVKGDTIVIGGKVNGTVNAKEKIVLEQKSNLRGDINTKILVVDAGAIFEGRSNMGTASQQQAPTPQPKEEKK